MLLEDAYCPECGSKIRKYLFSIINLFYNPGDPEDTTNFTSLFIDNNIEVCETDNMLNYSVSLSLEFVDIYNTDKIKALSKLYDMIRDAIDDNNEIVQRAFSMEDSIPDNTNTINLLELDGFRNEYDINQFSWLYSLDDLNARWSQYKNIYEFLHNNFTLCQIVLPHPLTRKSEGKYLIKLLIPGQAHNRILRVCDYCGKHIDSYLGIYPQKIISFAGTPASGKSATLISFYKHLYDMRRSGTLNMAFDWDSPNYKFFDDGKNKIDVKLAPEKTPLGESPSLTVRLKHTGENLWKIYTFVDSPGEMFEDSRGKGDVNFKRRTIIAESDVLLVLFSSEQLFPAIVDNINNVHADAKALDRFQAVYKKVLIHRTRMNPLKKIILISKPDQIFDRADKLFRYSAVDDKTYIGCLGCRKNMDQTEFDDLWNRLNTEKPEYNIQEGKLICEEFETISCLMKKFLLAMNKRTIERVMSNLYNFGDFNDKELENTSVCLVSPLGFAAWENFNDHNELLSKYYPNENIENILKDDWRYKEAYEAEHDTDFPRGVYYCLFHIFFETQFLVDPYENEMLQNTDKEMKIKSKIQTAKKLQQSGDKKEMEKFENMNHLEKPGKLCCKKIKKHKEIIGNYIRMLENTLMTAEKKTKEIQENRRKYHGYIL